MNRLVIVFLFIASFSLKAQEKESSTDFYDLSLEEILNTKISVSKTELTQRESPNIVSVISKEEIQKMGARDITDVLNQIPGFTFGVDVQNSIGISARGAWALEGKILILLDGQEMNELLYGNTMIGQNYDVTQIERIEVIRGPGSSIYGGYAELGVINIITKSGEQLRGMEVRGSYGAVKNSYARKNLSLSLGNSNEKIQYAIHGIYGKGIRSNQTYTDVFGSQLDLSKNSATNPGMVNGNIKIKNFNARFIYDNYSVTTADWYVDIHAPKDAVHFSGTYGQVDYKIKASEKLIITPQLNFKKGIPWRTNKNTFAEYSVGATRVSPKLNVNWTPSSNFNLVAGFDSYFDQGKLNYYHSPVTDGYFPNGSNTISYNDIGVFFQGLIQTKAVNITVGAREDIHNQFGKAFSPRLGVNKQIKDFHFKLLYSRAFRAPTIETLRVNPDLQPERTGVAELELGYKLNKNMFITGNIFDISITNTIYYYAVSATEANFYNGKKSGSRGFELEYKYKHSRGWINANYAFYSVAGKNAIELYGVPGDKSASLSAPRHRVNFNSSFKLTDNFSINPSANILGNRYGFSPYVNNEKVLTTFKTSVYMNLFFNYENLFTKGLNLGLGVYNLLDKKQLFIQPYDGDHAPLPGLSREVMVRMTYAIPY
jgi:outer membrane cobalamin receptor